MMYLASDAIPLDDVSAYLGVSPSARIGVTRRSAATLSHDIARWLRDRRADARFARFAGHFAALEAVTGHMVRAIEADLPHLGVPAPSGIVYERCRAADGRLATVRRLHEWYADKYDQRLAEPAGTVLRAADEVVRSCWAEPFAAVDRDAPTGPLTYLDPRFDASSTPRVSVPADLRAPGDALIGAFVRQLPIPIVALPAISSTEPWWLVLAAHETGHHVQHDLAADLVARTRDTVTEVAGAIGGGERAACWSGWAQEVFADAFALLAVGPAATWAVEELQHGPPGRLVTMPSPGSRYPPPAVRTALLGELAREAGAHEPGPGVADVGSWLATVGPPEVPAAARDAVAALLPMVRPVARAVVAIEVDGVPLREVCGWDAAAFGPGGPVTRWEKALLTDAPAVPGREMPAAARYGIAGGVAAYRTVDGDACRTRLGQNLPSLIASCGPPGSLAARPGIGVDALAARLADRLLAEGAT